VKRLRLLVLASGRGSHAANLIDATRSGSIDGEVVRVVCDRADAPALERARERGVPTTVFEAHASGARLDPDAERRLETIVREDRADLIALCGFMRLLGAGFLDRVGVPILNVHPSLLPSFRGLHAQRQAIEAGVRVTGATVHFVDAGMDSGPILLQAALAVNPGETAEELADRLLPLERTLYVDAIRLIQAGAVRREGSKVHIDPERLPAAGVAGRERRT
jgi:phosphoribosylglycinamide formyltransferase 1